MIENYSVLALIPARGGSKGIPRKNIRNLGGKPLIAWTIEEAKKSRYIDRLILSSESKEIIELAKKLGCEVPFTRPAEFAQDDTPGVEPVLHAIGMLPSYDYVVLLQPTSPLRTIEDIDGCIEYCIQNEANVAVTVSEPNKSPYWMYTLDEKQHLIPLIKESSHYTRRQDIPKVYTTNGAVYVAKTSWLRKKRVFISKETVGYLMPTNRSMDLDTMFDFELLDSFLRNKGKKFHSKRI